MKYEAYIYDEKPNSDYAFGVHFQQTLPIQ